MKILKRILVFGILCSIIQLVAYYSILYVGITLGQSFMNPDGLELTGALLFGIQIYLSLILFGTIILASNIIMASLHSQKWTKYLLIIPVFICIIAWGEDFKTWPLRTSLFIVASLVSIMLNPIINRKLEKKLRLGQNIS